MVPNPYSSQLADLPSLRSGSKKGLDLIYKAMQKNLKAMGSRLDKLNVGTARGIAKEDKGLGTRLGDQRKDALKAVLGHATEFDNQGDAALMAELNKLATDDIGEWLGYQGSMTKRDAEYQKGLRGIDKQYTRDLQASARRERQARFGELEQNFLALSSGLSTQSAMFDAQNSLLGFQQGMTTGGVGPAVGGGNAQISGRETANVQNLMRFAAQQWGIQVGGWRAHGSVPNSDHPKGLAADLMIHNAAQGAQIAGYFQLNAAQWGVKYIIWNNAIWSPGKGWRPYHGPNPHTDHVHVSTRY